MSTLKLEESTGTLEIFLSTNTLEIFRGQVLSKMRFRSTFKYATSDFTGISKPSSIRKGHLRFISKALGLGNAGKVLSLVFELLLENYSIHG